MSMHKTAVDLYLAVQEVHAKAHVALQELEELIKKSQSLEDLADFTFALRSIVELSDDTRKKADAACDLAQRICVLRYTNDPEQVGEPIRTAHCTATPDVKMIATIPRRTTQPEDFALLMNYFGVKPEFYSNPEGKDVVRAHFPGVCEHISQCLEKGLPLPPGIDPNKTYPVYSLIVRRKKGVSQ